jgi:hypothetical protein
MEVMKGSRWNPLHPDGTRSILIKIASARRDVMGTNHKPLHAIDIAVYDRNRRRIPPEVLEPYAGQWVAISGDGTQVLASGVDLETAEQNLAALGIPGNSVGWERIPRLDEESWL